ncbi:MAG: CDP-diacylglycerol--glycerol-3-phosphate 3-phosphatidyltransferase [Planctomycetes bacterium]|nr:CDP-diacylglycerol--glycerol-3-phosphate 3-phosphatidyltransferase [Planctomycetota bacterium]
MRRSLPNQITVLRLVLACVFFIVLNLYRYPHECHAALPWAIAIFLLAVATDWLDGHLARLWKAESTFGRIMDPFCDKVLIIGAFVYLSGPRFVDPNAVIEERFFTMISGVYPWMVAIILARELLVTNIRGEMEDLGVKFGASLWGKLKMILQSTAVPVVLLLVAMDPHRRGHEWMAVTRDVLVYTTVVVTVLSGVPYIVNAARALRGKTTA